MPLDSIQTGAIAPAFALLPAQMSGRRATVMLLTIGLQESDLQYRRQKNGPARGLWQFEKAGGVVGVLNFRTTQSIAAAVCLNQGIAPNAQAVYDSLEGNDVLAAAFARLLLWTDPKPLPALGDVEQAWQLYIRVWRPGALARDPEGLRKRWTGNYAQALEQVALA